MHPQTERSQHLMAGILSVSFSNQTGHCAFKSSGGSSTLVQGGTSKRTTSRPSLVRGRPMLHPYCAAGRYGSARDSCMISGRCDYPPSCLVIVVRHVSTSTMTWVHHLSAPTQGILVSLRFCNLSFSSSMVKSSRNPTRRPLERLDSCR